MTGLIEWAHRFSSCLCQTLGCSIVLTSLLLTACASPRAPFDLSPAEYERARTTIKKTTQAIRTNPDDGIAYSNRSAALYRLGNYKAAVNDATRAIQLRPHDAVAHANRAAAKYAYGDEEGAVADAQEALKLDPSLEAARDTLRQAHRSLESEPRYSLGYLRANEFDAAPATKTLSPQAIHQAIERASAKLRLNPSDTQAYVDRGVMRLYADDYRGAVEDTSEALRLDAKQAAAYLIRSFAKQKLDDAAGAKDDQEKADTLVMSEEFTEHLTRGELGERTRIGESNSTAAPTYPAKLDDLIKMLSQRAASFTYYPDVAREQLLEGKVLVLVRIDRQGRLVQSQIRESSGHTILDRAALLTIRAMFPLPLSEPLDRELRFTIPFRYELEL